MKQCKSISIIFMLFLGLFRYFNLFALSLMIQANQAKSSINEPQLRLHSAINETDTLHPLNKVQPNSYGLGMEVLYNLHNIWPKKYHHQKNIY